MTKRNDSQNTIFNNDLPPHPPSTHPTEVILHEQHQRVVVPACARTAHHGSQQKRLENDFY